MIGVSVALTTLAYDTQHRLHKKDKGVIYYTPFLKASYICQLVNIKLNFDSWRFYFFWINKHRAKNFSFYSVFIYILRPVAPYSRNALCFVLNILKVIIVEYNMSFGWFKYAEIILKLPLCTVFYSKLSV